MPEKYEYILELAYALAHLPADDIQAGIDHIGQCVLDVIAEGEINDEVTEDLQGFVGYLRSFWQPLAEILSVYDLPIKTNNGCENFHVFAKKTFGVRPNIYRELGKYTYLLTVWYIYVKHCHFRISFFFSKKNFPRPPHCDSTVDLRTKNETFSRFVLKK